MASDDNGLLRSQYEDSLIQIIWKCDGKRFWFNLLNKTNYPITIDWDNIVFVDTDSEIGNVIHSGTKYIDRNNGQLKTIVPRKAKISDFLVPSKNCVFNQGGILPSVDGKKTTCSHVFTKIKKHWIGTHLIS